MATKESTATTDPAETAVKLSSFISKLEGIDHFVAVSEGFPLAFTGISPEDAEASAALAVDLATVSEETLKEILGKKAREIVIDLGENKIIDVAKAKSLLLLLQGRRKPAEEAIRIAVSYIEGARVSCPYCQHDLTLEISKCPHCGASIPFNSSVCPHCGKPVYIKKCPNCNRMTTARGEKVEYRRSGDAAKLAAFEGMIGGAIVGFLSTLFGDPMMGILGGLIGGIAIGALLYIQSPKEYIVKT